MNLFQRKANIIKIITLYNLDNGLSINSAKERINELVSKGEYETCEGIKQAIEIKEKEFNLLIEEAFKTVE